MLNFFKRKNESKFFNKQVYLAIGIPAFLLIVLIGGLFAYQSHMDSSDKIHYGVHIGRFDVGGMTEGDAQKYLLDEIASEFNNGIAVEAKGLDFEETITVPYDSDLFVYEVDKSVERAYLIGREGSSTTRLYAQFRAWLGTDHLDIPFILNSQRVEDYLQDSLGQYIIPVTNAEVSIQSSGAIEISPEQVGYGFLYSEALEDIEANLKRVENRAVVLEGVMLPVEVTQKDIELLQEQLEGFAEIPSIKLIVEAEGVKTINWDVRRRDFLPWITVKRRFNAPVLALHDQKFEEYLDENIAPLVSKKPKNAIFEMENDVVTRFEPSEDGYVVNIEESIKSAENGLFVNKAYAEIFLVIDKVHPEVTTADSNSLGINELLGTGTSAYYGSPANRRHNIATGAKSVDLTLIPPGEDFSLLKVLGEINGESGYLQELVIKGDRTIPEYGGGLCQIGTTAFRGALNVGLPITERRNHSYRVSYYEPAGTDATIYDPAPDFKFNNDTPGHILITTEIIGSDLTYYFWGTSDGREVTVGKPRIYDIVQPPDTKYIGTDDLPEGEIDCIEKAHAGASAELSRTVTYADGTVDEKTWFSKYRPWRQVCLVGNGPSVIIENGTLVQEEVAEE
jgi:vancomycin resistance protein YoaR